MTIVVLFIFSILLMVLVNMSKKTEGFENHKNKEKCYDDNLCNLREIYDKKKHCSSVIGINQRPVNLNPNNLKNKRMMDF